MTESGTSTETPGLLYFMAQRVAQTNSARPRAEPRWIRIKYLRLYDSIFGIQVKAGEDQADG